MLKIKAKELAAENTVTRKYVIKGKLKPGAGLPPPPPNVHDPNEANSMKEKRHMTVVTEMPDKAPGVNGRGAKTTASGGKGGCCAVS